MLRLPILKSPLPQGMILEVGVVDFILAGVILFAVCCLLISKCKYLRNR